MNQEINPVKLVYEKKPDTQASYYLKQGPEGYLPKRLSIGKGLAPVRVTEKTRNAIAQIKASYRQDESGLYKAFNKGQVTSSIFPKYEFPDFTGYAIFDERYQVFDLWIIRSEDSGQSYELNLFRGLAKVQYDIDECFRYLLTKEKGNDD